MARKRYMPDPDECFDSSHVMGDEHQMPHCVPCIYCGRRFRMLSQEHIEECVQKKEFSDLPPSVIDSC